MPLFKTRVWMMFVPNVYHYNSKLFQGNYKPLSKTNKQNKNKSSTILMIYFFTSLLNTRLTLGD